MDNGDTHYKYALPNLIECMLDISVIVLKNKEIWEQVYLSLIDKISRCPAVIMPPEDQNEVLCCC